MLPATPLCLHPNIPKLVRSSPEQTSGDRNTMSVLDSCRVMRRATSGRWSLNTTTCCLVLSQLAVCALSWLAERDKGERGGGASGSVLGT